MTAAALRSVATSMLAFSAPLRVLSTWPLSLSCRMRLLQPDPELGDRARKPLIGRVGEGSQAIERRLVAPEIGRNHSAATRVAGSVPVAAMTSE